MKKSALVFSFLFLFTGDAYSQSGWTQVNTGLPYNIYKIYFFNNNTGLALGALTSIDSSIILRSTNGGLNWFNICNLSGWFRDFCFIDINTGYAAGNFQRILKTTNGGYNWATISTGSNSLFVSINFPNADTGYAAGNGVIKKTTNAGSTFFTQQVNTPPNWSPLFYEILFTSGNTGFAVGNDYGSIARTVNGGSVWSFAPIGVTYNRDVFFLNQNTGFAMGFASGNNMRISRTFDNGNSWNYSTIIIPSQYESMFFTDINTGYIVGSNAIGSYGILIKTTNGGMNWNAQSITSQDIFMRYVYFINLNTGFVSGVGGNIFRTTTAGEPVGIHPISTEIPKNFSLSQNYPNPFNPTTKIRFSITSPHPDGHPSPERRGDGGEVKLSIYDVLGKEVATLVNESATGGLKPGTYEVDWDGTNFSSGIYYYTLIVGASTPLSTTYKETKKMVLLK